MRLLLLPAGLAEIIQEVDGMLFDHAAQLNEALVGLGIGVQNSLRDPFGLFDNISG